MTAIRGYGTAVRKQIEKIGSTFTHVHTPKEHLFKHTLQQTIRMRILMEMICYS